MTTPQLLDITFEKAVLNNNILMYFRYIYVKPIIIMIMSRIIHLVCKSKKTTCILRPKQKDILHLKVFYFVIMCKSWTFGWTFLEELLLIDGIHMLLF